MKTYDNISLIDNASIIDALKKMDESTRKLLLVKNYEGKFIGVLSIGDIQRAILSGKNLETPVVEILRKNFKYFKDSDNINDIKNFIHSNRVEFMPVLDKNGKLIVVHFWEDFFSQKRLNKKQNCIPTVIMAGGKGTRLKPLTNIIPKPLLPISDKTIIEDIIERFIESGSKNFYISVNYMSDAIIDYFKNKEISYQVDFFKEKKPLGTAGSLYLLKNKIHSTFFVSNCDILINHDYNEILDFHNDNKFELTIIAPIKNISIPYGTITTKKGGILSELKEKPNLNFFINSGFYILEPHLFDEIPENEFFHITDLIELIKNRDGKIGVFPISEGSWKDIGTWKLYLKNIRLNEDE